MSTTSASDRDPQIDGCRPADVTPVTLDASALESTAPQQLREFKRALIDQGLTPATLTVDACFDENCSLATQDEIDRIRRYVRAGAFLGVGTVTVAIDEVADPEKVRPALSACAERADRDGLTLDVDGDVSIEY
ncbi:sugar phosphate isomerase/epimerase [Halosolutus gelatinilyticus]|uniref:sugar phosphate isomerase/epimerase n=1 Tax=Halosolutus gelatinilyticus TaxID=2931975 RepID=UPI001FF32741|nr:sugar phosphate isomerase/epimerase [Halosolutus gelatinilyticus]